MSKAVLVIDMPERCIDCPCHFYSEPCLICGVDVNTVEPDKNGEIEDVKPDWCPLRPLPEKKEYKGIDGITAEKLKTRIYESNKESLALGWNACIDAITGGTE